jgi:hypothetical protein
MTGLRSVFLGIGFQLLSSGSPKYLLIRAWVGPTVALIGGWAYILPYYQNWWN